MVNIERVNGYCHNCGKETEIEQKHLCANCDLQFIIKQLEEVWLKELSDGEDHPIFENLCRSIYTKTRNPEMKLIANSIEERRIILSNPT